MGAVGRREQPSDHCRTSTTGVPLQTIAARNRGGVTFFDTGNNLRIVRIPPGTDSEMAQGWMGRPAKVGLSPLCLVPASGGFMHMLTHRATRALPLLAAGAPARWHGDGTVLHPAP